ncbi:hypothetical protein EJ08DRAFT_80031 [Tothia fuscella]|uniref:Amino acid transporter n=1 Tax=Tothia fuscella TaxID=1048955 RepID=A0A9P4NEG3_9PEZI|nr:hypothetical protein EJ08DRAFT_80031 [Tothia fuscella]
MVLNRTIGSGIFTVPPKVLAGTGSVGGSLLVWAFAGIISICGVLCWLELGMSIPFRKITENGVIRKVSTPRSGGEKNWLEYIFKKPLLFITSVYGIMFLILGNISGNAIAFGIYVMIAAGKEPVTNAENNHQKAPVIGLAVGLLTFSAGIHVFTRRGGIWLNNIFAVLKIAMILALAILGTVHAGRKYLQSDGIGQSNPAISSADINIASKQLSPDEAFLGGSSHLTSYAESFLFALFSYTGYEQPFYVLSEVARPRRVFPTYTILGMVVATFLYVMVNISYFCVVPKEVYTMSKSNSIDMAGEFLHFLFDDSSTFTAKQVMAGLVAFSVFGNVIVMTFTAARVKQEIAKEGILPFSLFFATGHTTPWAKLQSRWQRGARSASGTMIGDIDLDDHLEQAPMAALALHWVSSVVLIAVTSMLKPATAYSFLISLYSYVNCMVVGCLVSGGLLYLKLDSYFRAEKGRNWAKKVDFKPWLSPLHAVVYFSATTFFLFTPFVKPPGSSPFSQKNQGYVWYLLPTIGLSSLLWGVMWWFGLKGFQWSLRKKLVVTRTAYIEKDCDGNYVQKAELVEHDWVMNVRSDDDRSNRSARDYDDASVRSV